MSLALAPNYLPDAYSDAMDWTLGTRIRIAKPLVKPSKWANAREGWQPVGKKTIELYDNVAVFTMSLKGGSLPVSFEVFIKVEMDFDGAKMADLYRCSAGGSSARILLQSQLRERTVRDLNKMASEGLQVRFNDIIAGRISGPADTLLALTLPQFVVEMAKMDMGTEQATEIYNRKHSIVDVEPETEDEDEETDDEDYDNPPTYGDPEDE